jgi:hypothetical protein
MEGDEEHTPSNWVLLSCSPIHVITTILCRSIATQFVSVLSQVNPVHTLLYYLRSILILSFHLSIGLLSGSFLYVFFFLSTDTHTFLSHACYLPGPSHPLTRRYAVFWNFLRLYLESLTQSAVRVTWCLLIWKASVTSYKTSDKLIVFSKRRLSSDHRS